MKFWKIKRTLPPAASPIYFRDIVSGLRATVRGESEIERFRTELKDYFGSRHCFLVSSGKTALYVLLKALQERYPERDQVLIPAFTCYSVPAVISRAGLKVRLCDVDPGTLDFDYGHLARILGGGAEESHASEETGAERILCVIPTHLFGLPSDIPRVRALVKDREITVVEDAAQAMGCEYGSRKLGTLGHVGFFSLGRGKAFSTVEGGIIITGSRDLGEIVGREVAKLPGYGTFGSLKLLSASLLLSLFLNPALFWFPRSLPFLNLGKTSYDTGFKMRKFTPYQAGLARNWKGRLKRFMDDRSKNTEYWKRNFRGMTFWGNGKIPNLVRYPIRIDDAGVRAAILLPDRGGELGIMAVYPDSVDGIEELGKSGRPGEFPAARGCAETLLTLPVHSLISGRDRKRIVSLFRRGI